MSRTLDTDYLGISARISALENKLLTKERCERILESKELTELSKQLLDCGYEELTVFSAQGVEVLLRNARANLLIEMQKSVAEPALVAIFQLKYDYHNAKTLIKAEKQGRNPENLLLAGSRLAPDVMAEKFEKEGFVDLSPIFKLAMVQSREILNATGDPQRADFILDRAYFEEMLHLAKTAKSKVLEDLTKLQIDIANLKIILRSLRLNKGTEFLKLALIEGGTISVYSLLDARDNEVFSLFTGKLAPSAEQALLCVKDNNLSLTAFEKACDETIALFVKDSTRVAFGEEKVIAYLSRKEAEFTSVRTLASGKLAGLPTDIILSRLRVY